MNSLFSEFFKKFAGLLLRVFETIQGHIWGMFWRCLGGIQKVLEGKTIPT